MSERNESGLAVPPEVWDEIARYTDLPNPFRSMFPTERKPLTHRQRFMVWRMHVWQSLHDLMFGAHNYDD